MGFDDRESCFFKQLWRAVFKLLLVHLIEIIFSHAFSDTVDDLAAKEIGFGQISQRNRNIATTVQKELFFLTRRAKRGFREPRNSLKLNFLKPFLGYLIDPTSEKTHVLFFSNSSPFGQIVHLNFYIFSAITHFFFLSVKCITQAQ